MTGDDLQVFMGLRMTEERPFKVANCGDGLDATTDGDVHPHKESTTEPRKTETRKARKAFISRIEFRGRSYYTCI